MPGSSPSDNDIAEADTRRNVGSALPADLNRCRAPVLIKRKRAVLVLYMRQPSWLIPELAAHYKETRISSTHLARSGEWLVRRRLGDWKRAPYRGLGTLENRDDSESLLVLFGSFCSQRRGIRIGHEGISASLGRDESLFRNEWSAVEQEWPLGR